MLSDSQVKDANGWYVPPSEGSCVCSQTDFDMAVTVEHHLPALHGIFIPIMMLTDSYSLFNVIMKYTTATQKRLMIYMEAARGAYTKWEISYVGWMRSEDNLVDGLTKVRDFPSLSETLRTGILAPKFEQWITRPLAFGRLN